LGSVASAASLAADVRASYARQPGQAVDTPGARLTLDAALRTAWRGLNVAQGIHDRDFAAAGVSALGLAAVARQATDAEPSKGLGLTDAANIADAALGYHQASRGEAAANAAVADAERALRLARSTGDPAAIRQAEANLQQTRKAREGALMSGIAAGETLVATAEALGQKRQELGQVEKLRQLASQRGEQLLSLLQDPRATAGQKREALAALVRLAQAGTAYEQALGTGDVSAMRVARAELEAVNELLRTRPPGSVQVASLGLRDAEPSASATGSGSGTPAGGQATGVYRVAEGDSLWRLAKNYGITVEELLAVNPGLGPEGRIRAGEVIRIPMPERSGTGAATDAVVTIEIPPPQGMGALSPQAASSGAGSRSAEGWGSFWAGVIEGDFDDNDSWSKTGGQVLVGLVPWVGQAADARDTLAALDQVRQGRPGGWLGLLAAGVAWIPGAGDALKGAIRGGRKVAGEATEAALEQAAKHVGTDAAEEAAETAARRTSPAGAAGTMQPKSLVPGSPEHRAARWSEYQARGGQWSYERWSKTYDRNMVQATQANAVVDDFWRQLGWGRREVVVDVEGVPRKLDIGDVPARRGVEYKTGYQTATQETLWEITRDQILIEQGWSIRWRFKGTVSEPLLNALRDAGIPYTVGK
jgi:LysM repeat protein